MGTGSADRTAPASPATPSGSTGGAGAGSALYCFFFTGAGIWMAGWGVGEGYLARRVDRKSAAWLVGVAEGSGLTDPAAGCDALAPAASPTPCNMMSWNKLTFLMPEHWLLRCQSQEEDCNIVSSKETEPAVRRCKLWPGTKQPGDSVVWCKVNKPSWFSGLLGADNMLTKHSATADDSVENSQRSIWDAASKQITREPMFWLSHGIAFEGSP